MASNLLEGRRWSETGTEASGNLKSYIISAHRAFTAYLQFSSAGSRGRPAEIQGDPPRTIGAFID